MLLICRSPPACASLYYSYPGPIRSHFRHTQSDSHASPWLLCSTRPRPLRSAIILNWPSYFFSILGSGDNLKWPFRSPYPYPYDVTSVFWDTYSASQASQVSFETHILDLIPQVSISLTYTYIHVFLDSYSHTSSKPNKNPFPLEHLVSHAWSYLRTRLSVVHMWVTSCFKSPRITYIIST